ncbi:hypothetical protein VOLCADRAFT_104338 [Volvox carteri f. nagariensis]|uniref:Uncharacterized protein n=1 Tax=Volvox carteri f. nagariensis TaxID=3068 RepID=D8TT12_VOLCA|nr:uncharacterized protein VOLCADRAFT_104338 [Volvox carteri f. nagariensis]EFJ49473.1 hypothetical protein VOLCADRAFT_104338 [Volvox carteri f. nagariensis]|eukprot:XP_002949454.1 hypothetical protein VOLCADRAFT_104338 [Volvox carteri f. nagariensis]
MSTVSTAIPSKKRAAADGSAVLCQASKKTAMDMTWPASGSMGSIPGWQYPPLPIGMIPPMPYCMAGNPFFPFMGMFPPFWLPAAAMAAAAMPALAAASATNTCVAPVVPNIPGSATGPTAAAVMWPMMSGTVASQPVSSVAAPMPVPARSNSGASSPTAIPSASCTNTVPTVGAGRSAASPPLLAASPGSVCNGGLQQPSEDPEFANFIDSFLLSEDGDLALHGGDGDLAMPFPDGMKVFQSGDFLSSGGSNASDATTDDVACLARNDSHCLLSLLGDDIDLTVL